jgi:D-alanine-D-alanine ligase
VRVAVLAGGDTNERDISLITGKAVVQALRDAGHEAVEIELGDPIEAVTSTACKDADVVFPALHGGAGEDGRIQSLLELVGKPYVGGGPGPCAIAMDKIWTKLLCRALQVPTAAWMEADENEGVEQLIAKADALGWPVVLKPVGEGSAIGVHIIESAGKAREGLPLVLPLRGRWMLERYVPGRELTLGIVAGETLPIVEIRPKAGFYDYKNKYTPGCSEYDCPAALSEAAAAEVTAHGLRLAMAIDLLELCRIDFRYDLEEGPFLLEANSMPGMTSTSLLPMAAKAQGTTFPALCDTLCRDALARRARGGQA